MYQSIPNPKMEIKADRVAREVDYEEVRQAAREVIADPDRWLTQENTQFGYKTPKDLIEQGNKQAVLDLIAAIKYGQYS